MAKKRGRKKKAPEPTPKHELPGGFWRQVAAVGIICMSVLFVVSWFNSGGPALVALNDFMQGIMGYGYYVLPFILTYLAVQVFKSDNFRVDPASVVSSVIMLILASGLCGAPSYGDYESTGGLIGDTLNGFIMENVNLPVAVFLYVTLIVITALFMYAKTPADLFRMFSDLFSTKGDSEDSDNARVIRKNRREKPAKEDVEERPLPKLKIRGAVAAEEIKPAAHGLLAKKSAKEEKRKVTSSLGAKPEVAKEESALIAINDMDWKMPSMDLLNHKKSPPDPGDIQGNANMISDTLNQFGIEVTVDGANVGPRITQYTLRPPQGVKVSKITQYDKELALNLAKKKIRIEAPIPGTRLVGVEVPNIRPASVGLYDLLRSQEWRQSAADKPLAFVVGKDISGRAIVGNLAKMPHLLIAGTTGSGKSVMTNTLIMSMLYHNSPADLRLIIVDPKQVEMAAYNDIPHLLTPVITQVDKALSALKWTVNEMERRYSLMAEKRVKNIVDYNKLIAKAAATKKNQPAKPVETPPNEDPDDSDGGTIEAQEGKMPYIVVVVDEMADLMMMAGKELEMLIVRIAQKGRAAGMHLVLATQRPEVKVVTGLIKANIPGRIAFAVNNNMDSRVMLDMSGAEKLLGMGDMLYLTTEMMGKPLRVQGAFVSDPEINSVTKFLREQRPVEYNDEVISQAVQVKGMPGGVGAMGAGGGDDDELNWNAAKVAVESGKLSTSLLGRRLNIGYGKAARAMDNLEQMGVISPAAGGNKPREVLIASMDDYPGPRFD